MKKKIIPVIIIIAFVAAGGAFFGGMKYGQSNSQFNRQRGFQSMAGNSKNIHQGGPNAGGFINGDILSKDEKSLTIKLRDGGSKIVFYSSATEVGKFVNGSSTDLEIGGSIMVNGKTNSDGSLTAQSIQIRPVMASSTFSK